MTQTNVKKGLSAMAKREERWAWLFIAAPFVGFMLFMAYPIAFALVASMSKWTGINSLLGNMVGFDNYAKILTDGHFWLSMGNTIIYIQIILHPRVLFYMNTLPRCLMLVSLML